MSTYELFIISGDAELIKEIIATGRIEKVTSFSDARYGLAVGSRGNYSCPYGHTPLEAVRIARGGTYHNVPRITAQKWLENYKLELLGVEGEPEPTGYTGDELIEIPEDYYEPEDEYDEDWASEDDDDDW